VERQRTSQRRTAGRRGKVRKGRMPAPPQRVWAGMRPSPIQNRDTAGTSCGSA
jgi:hypothetical protein